MTAKKEMYKPIDIKRAVSEDRKVKMLCYQDGLLYYKTEFDEVFTVPITDTDKAKFLSEDKALLFMRWMRKWNDDLGN